MVYTTKMFKSPGSMETKIADESFAISSEILQHFALHELDNIRKTSKFAAASDDRKQFIHRKFVPDAFVEIFGLASTKGKQLNGRLGVVTDTILTDNKGDRRYPVKILHLTGEVEAVSLKARNINPFPKPEQESKEKSRLDFMMSNTQVFSLYKVKPSSAGYKLKGGKPILDSTVESLFDFEDNAIEYFGKMAAYEKEGEGGKLIIRNFVRFWIERICKSGTVVVQKKGTDHRGEPQLGDVLLMKGIGSQVGEQVPKSQMPILTRTILPLYDMLVYDGLMVMDNAAQMTPSLKKRINEHAEKAIREQTLVYCGESARKGLWNEDPPENFKAAYMDQMDVEEESVSYEPTPSQLKVAQQIMEFAKSKKYTGRREGMAVLVVRKIDFNELENPKRAVGLNWMNPNNTSFNGYDMDYFFFGKWPGYTLGELLPGLLQKLKKMNDVPGLFWICEQSVMKPLRAMLKAAGEKIGFKEELVVEWYPPPSAEEDITSAIKKADGLSESQKCNRYAKMKFRLHLLLLLAASPTPTFSWTASHHVKSSPHRHSMKDKEGEGEVDLNLQDDKKRHDEARRSPYPSVIVEVQSTPPPEFGATAAAVEEAKPDGDDVKKLEALFGISAATKKAGVPFHDASGEVDRRKRRMLKQKRMKRNRRWLFDAMSSPIDPFSPDDMCYERGGITLIIAIVVWMLIGIFVAMVATDVSTIISFVAWLSFSVTLSVFYSRYYSGEWQHDVLLLQGIIDLISMMIGCAQLGVHAISYSTSADEDWLISCHGGAGIVWVVVGLVQSNLTKQRSRRFHQIFGYFALLCLAIHMYFTIYIVWQNPVKQHPVILFTYAWQILNVFKHAYYALDAIQSPAKHKMHMFFLYLKSTMGAGPIRFGAWALRLVGQFLPPKIRTLVDRGDCQMYVGEGNGDASGCWKAVFLNIILSDFIIVSLENVYFLASTHANEECLRADKEQKKSEMKQQVIMVAPTVVLVLMDVNIKSWIGHYLESSSLLYMFVEFIPFIWCVIVSIYFRLQPRQEDECCQAMELVGDAGYPNSSFDVFNLYWSSIRAWANTLALVSTASDSLAEDGMDAVDVDALTDCMAKLSLSIEDEVD